MTPIEKIVQTLAEDENFRREFISDRVKAVDHLKLPSPLTTAEYSALEQLNVDDILRSAKEMPIEKSVIFEST